jgi:glycosyltransferase involved in cell wall biosynthesis
MKILLLHNRYKYRGGEDVCVEAQKKLLESRGDSVLLLEANNDEIVGAAGSARTAFSAVYSQRWKARVISEIKDFRPDIGHVHNTFPVMSPSVIYACKDMGVPVVQTLHNYRLACPNALFYRDGKVCEECLPKPFAWNAILHRCYRGSVLASTAAAATLAIHKISGTYTEQVDAFVVLTEFARRKFIEAKLPASKLNVIPNWVDPDPGAGTGAGGFFLFVGRLSEEKGVRTLLRAWKQAGTTAQLKIAGTGPLELLVTDEASRNPSIEYLGQQSAASVSQLMQQAAAVVIPSECYEGFPRAAIEAFAAGTPIIASRIGSLGNVTDGITGIGFTPADARELAEAVSDFNANPLQAATMRSTARLAYETKYTADVAYESLTSLYRSLC